MVKQFSNSSLLPYLLVMGFALLGVNRALASVTVTGAFGGESISADTAANATSQAWTTLGPITIAEGADDDFAMGNAATLVLKVPEGFEFNTNVTPDISFTPNRNITSASVGFNNSKVITITLDVALLPLGALDTLSLGASTAIQVRPTAGGPLVSGTHIHRPAGTAGGTANIAGITADDDGSGGSNFGNLAEVAGTAALIRVETLANGSGTVVLAQNLTAGSSITNYSVMRDSYGNFITNAPADLWSLSDETGGVVDGDLTPSSDLRSAVFTAHVRGSAKIRVASGTLSQTISGVLTVLAGSATRMFVTLPNETFTEGSGNSGTVVVQKTGTAFTITRLTAADNFTNIATTYSGSRTITYTGPGGSPTYTTNVSFTAGQSTSTLTTKLTQPETTTITATASGLAGIPSSSLTVKPENTPPSIGVIGNQMVIEDQPTEAIQLVLSDPDGTPELSLQPSGVSANQVLVPDGNIFFGQANGHWYTTVTPVFGQTGSATITVTVSDGVNSNSTDFLLTVNPPPAGYARYFNASSISIPDSGEATPYPSTINVSGMVGTITNLTVTLSKFSHGRVQDVNMLLVGPTGLGGAVIFREISGDNRSVNNGVTVTLTDASLFALPEHFDLWSEPLRPADFEPGAGSFLPPAPVAPYDGVALSTFNGQPANGNWSLYVYDDQAVNTGSIVGGWSLMVATTGGTIPAPTILSLTRTNSTNVVIRWSAVSNVTYRVQYQPSLNPANWSNLVPDITATNSTASAIDHPIGAARRFYRILIVP